MFLLFMGIGSSIQPMISYFYGANLTGHIKETIKIAEKSAVVIGGLFLVIGYFAADYLVAMFGITSTEITDLAVTGIRLFFIGYFCVWISVLIAYVIFIFFLLYFLLFKIFSTYTL